MAIPKIIHQTFADQDSLHVTFVENILRLKKMNKKWEHKFYDDKQQRRLINEFYGSDVLKIYDSINPVYGAARADFFRYLLLYMLGGVYLDIKSTVTRSLDETLREGDSYLLSHWNPETYQAWGSYPEYGVENEYQQWHIVASPRHPFLESVIRNVKRNLEHYDTDRDGVGKKAVLKLTGPIAYTLAIREIREYHDHRVVDIEDLGFRYSIIGPPGKAGGHIPFFRNHYSSLAEPLVLKRKRSYWFW